MYKIKTLKLNKLVFSGDKAEVLKIKPYFKEIIYLKYNHEILTFTSNEPKIIFFNCDEKDYSCIQTIQTLRQQDRKSLIIIMSKQKNENIFLEGLSLHLSGFLQKPFKKSNIEQVLKNIVQDLAYLNNDEGIQLADGYSFNLKQLTLFDQHYNVIKLTKNETKLMEILAKKKNTYVPSEVIEHNIWEEESLEQDCNKRLKHLIYCLRKKLPTESLVNSYSLGYKFVAN
ncbi:MAG: Putative two-component response regulator [uncultured Sulfurovum sp.]|uniref:Two-component response regulator n=1 Tax=uncultured Sulfurovum sp. TaxID=269237 RepID=A0A6S6S346_9BACT|nr:MAG: Putative two-component response regulator [uncultured Sulfurovum sp.]